MVTEMLLLRPGRSHAGLLRDAMPKTVPSAVRKAERINVTLLWQLQVSMTSLFLCFFKYFRFVLFEWIYNLLE